MLLEYILLTFRDWRQIDFAPDSQISLHPPADVDGPQLLKDLIIRGETTSKWMKLGQAESNQTQTRSQQSRPD